MVRAGIARADSHPVNRVDLQPHRRSTYIPGTPHPVTIGCCVVFQANLMNKPFTTLLLLSALLATAAMADSNVSTADRNFVAMVSQGGMFEVKAAQVASDKGNTQDIKDQGATESHDHLLVGAKLKSIASSNGIQTADSLNDLFQKKLDALSALSGTAFDAAYLKDMKEIHAKDGSAFAKESASGTNPDLKAFAAETHRIVLRHIGELSAIGPKTAG